MYKWQVKAQKANGRSASQKYRGFCPTLFSEKLAELEGIHIGDETVRNDNTISYQKEV